MTYQDGYRLPKSVLKKERAKLDEIVSNLIDAARNNKEPLKQRWEALEAMYRQDPGSSGMEVFKGNDTRTTPLMKSRVGRLVDTVHSSLTATSPHCQAIPFEQSQKRADALEKSVQTVMDVQQFGEYQRLALRDAALCGLGVIWAPLTEDGVKYHHVHPGKFIVLPNLSHDQSRLFCIGHLSQVPYFELCQLQEQGKIRKDAEFLPVSSEYADSDGTSPLMDATDEDTGLPMDFQNVEVWQLLVKLHIGDRKGWWLIWYAEDSQQCINIEEYPYEQPWYTIYRLHYEPSCFWPEVPVANALQSIQHNHSTLAAVLEQGAVALSTGMLIVNGVFADQVEHKSIQPGEIIRMAASSGGATATPVFPAMRIDHIPPVLQKLEADADAAIGVNKTAVGQELNNATATEVQQLQAAQAQSENAYSSCAADGLESHYGLVTEYFKRSWTEMNKAYGKRISVKETLDSLKIQAEWKATGRAADATPQAQMQKLQALYQMAQNPNSILDPYAVEKRIIEEIGIGNTDELLKENNAQVQQPTQAMVGGQGGPGGVPAAAQGIEGAGLESAGAVPAAGPMPDSFVPSEAQAV